MAQNAPPPELKLSATVSDTGQTHHYHGQAHQETWSRTHKLGEGAYGAVWQEKCTSGPQHKLQQLRAVKVSRRRNEKAWRRELNAMHKFSEYPDRFVQLWGWFEDANNLYIAMEHVNYGTLHDHVREKALPENEATIIVAQLGQALQYMHDASFLHRDLKLLNILVARPAPDWQVKMADFGITKDMNSMGATTAEIGTISYMAPEILLSRENKYTKAGDIWSLGVVAYCLLTRNPPFKHLHELMEFGKGGVPFPTKPLEKKRCSSLSIKFIEAAMAPVRENRPTIQQVVVDPWLVLEPDTDSDPDDAEDWGAPSKDWADTWEYGTNQDSTVTFSASKRRDIQPQRTNSNDQVPPATDVGSTTMSTFPLQPKTSIIPSNSRVDSGQNKATARNAGPEFVNEQQKNSHSILTAVPRSPTMHNQHPGAGNDADASLMHKLIQAQRFFDQHRARMDPSSGERRFLDLFQSGLNEATAATASPNNVSKQRRMVSQPQQASNAKAQMRPDEAIIFAQELFTSKELLEAWDSPKKAIFVASAQGLTTFLKYTLGALDIDLADDDGLTALHYAVLGGSIKSVNFLLAEGCNVNASSRTHGTPLCLAAAKSARKILMLLLDGGADVLAPGGQVGSALHAACAAADLEVTRALINHGAPVDLRRTVHMHVLAKLTGLVTIHSKTGSFQYKDCQPMIVAIQAANLTMLRVLIEAGANVNALHRRWASESAEATFQDVDNKSDNVTGLMLAAAWDYNTIVQLLLDSGVDKDARDVGGSTAIIHATDWNSHISLETLLRRGASVHYKDSDGWGCLQVAACRGGTACLKILLDHGMDINGRDDNRNTALMSAAQKGHVECVSLLCARGASVHSKDGQGNTALHFAAHNGHVDVIGILLEYGARIDAVTDVGETPAIVASLQQHEKALEALIVHGAQVALRSHPDVTLAQLKSGVRGGDVAVNAFLETAGASSRKLLGQGGSSGQSEKQTHTSAPVPTVRKGLRFWKK